ncbi:MAG: YdeI/OmpD-associated family protein [Bryobacteraceae bacterium]|nr:YdeI/OmpD-associated family protein [Bryobacteraceae bacterium]
MQGKLASLERVPVETRAAWRAWLRENYRRPDSVWVVTYKKYSGKPYVAYDELVEEALCYGWIDSVGGKVDDERTMLLFSPRRKGSVWSKPNKERVARLIANGSMRKPGLDKIEAAKADGSWAALDDVDAMILPDDLAAALRANPAGQAAWDARTDSRKKQALQWLTSAKRPETRAARIEKLASGATLP